MTYELSALAVPTGGVPRILHGLAARAPLTFLRRGIELVWEVSAAAVLDSLAPLKGSVRETLKGQARRSHASMALYVHWSPDGRISTMVQRQVRLWHESGFDVVFISNAEQRPPDPDWAEMANHCVLCIHRANVGRDFGAWRDGAALAIQHFGVPDELLLANDSVLGPFKPLGPMVDAWRAGGEGFFGLTESLGGGSHLQSYALLTRGRRPVESLLAYLAAYKDSRSKWRVVQRGEIGLSRHMRAAGYHCAALFGYARLISHVDDATRKSLGARFAAPEAMETYPLNPSHHLWRVLIECMDFPYLKTELVRRNPGNLPGVDGWAQLVPADEARLIRDHLAIMRGGSETGMNAIKAGRQRSSV